MPPKSPQLVPKIPLSFTRRNAWSLSLGKFYVGFAHLAFANSLTEDGSPGSASAMTNMDCITDLLTQGPGLANLTNGTQAGAVTELINHILDQAVANDVAYGIGTTKLFQISSTAVTNAGNWPHTISGCTRGESVELLKGNLYYFYNTSGSAGDIGKYDLTAGTFSDTWGSSSPTGKAALQNAIHPSDKKEDILLFGNGRYVGVYFNDSNTLTVNKLDFGNDAVVADVLFNSGQWYLAVNSGITGTNRTEGSIFVYDGGAITNTLADEAGVGMARIGFLYRVNGVVYIAYQDISSTGFIIGYISGKTIKPLAHFTGTLPNYQKKTLFKNTILLLSDNLAYSAGAYVPELPHQLSQHASSRYATTGAIAAPFGTPLISSTDGGSNFSLDKFSGYTTNASWKSLVFDLAKGTSNCYIDSIVVKTNSLGAGASCSLTIEANQNTSTSTAQVITTTGKRKHIFRNFGLNNIDDFRIALDFSGGSSQNNVSIRSIVIMGHYIEN
jgi:hypothetical protein